MLLAAVLSAAGATLLVGADAAPAAATPAPAPAAVPAPAIAVEELLETYGWILGQDLEVFALGLSESEVAALQRGLAGAARGAPAPENIGDVGPGLRDFLTRRPLEVKNQRLEEGRAEEEKLFASLEGNPAVKKTESGLRYEILSPGTAEKPTASDTIVANYTGRFSDGTIFNDTFKKNEPAEFSLNNVIVGWQEGIPLIGTGGRIRLYVPSKLGYGDTGRMAIPPGKPLIFEIALVSVKPTPQEPPAPQPAGPQFQE